jgi:signal transduction histidine kinase
VTASLSPPGPLVLDPPAAGETSQRLLAEFSHDLRTPLTSVRLLVQALRDDLVDEDRRSEHLAQIELQVLVLSALVEQLHSLGREQAGDPGSIRECVASQALIDAAVDTMRIQAEFRGVTLKRDLPPDLPPLDANPIQLHRALLNLLENAIRHAREGGAVTVRAERTVGGIEIEIEDDGEGIAADERDRVFLAFHGDDRQRSTARSGLGLAITRATVEAHGGRIWIAESASGTRVRLSLPVREESSLPCRDGHVSRPKF